MEYSSNKSPNWCSSGGIFVHTVAKIFKIGQNKKANKKVSDALLFWIVYEIVDSPCQCSHRESYTKLLISLLGSHHASFMNHCVEVVHSLTILFQEFSHHSTFSWITCHQYYRKRNIVKFNSRALRIRGKLAGNTGNWEEQNFWQFLESRTESRWIFFGISIFWW